MKKFFILLIVSVLSLNCSMVKSSKIDEKDISKKWTLVQMQNKKLPISETIILNIQQSEGRFSGNSGCNQIGGEIRIIDKNISLSDIYSTQMLCNPKIMQFEQEYTLLLEKVASFEVSEKTLTLFDKNKNEILYFEL